MQTEQEQQIAMFLENFVILPVWQSKMSRIVIQRTTNVQPSDFSLSYTTMVEHIKLFNVPISSTPLQGKHNTPVLQMLRWGTGKLSDMLKSYNEQRIESRSPESQASV